MIGAGLANDASKIFFHADVTLYRTQTCVVGVLFLKNIFRKSNDYYCWSKVYEKWDRSHFVHFEKHPNCSNEMAL